MTEGAGTARRHTFKIFALAVFRVALRIGTKLRGAEYRRGRAVSIVSVARPRRGDALDAGYSPRRPKLPLALARTFAALER
jgi:hypothetical protein